jgi:hypothetical protein
MKHGVVSLSPTKVCVQKYQFFYFVVISDEGALAFDGVRPPSAPLVMGLMVTCTITAYKPSLSFTVVPRSLFE